MYRVLYVWYALTLSAIWGPRGLQELGLRLMFNPFCLLGPKRFAGTGFETLRRVRRLLAYTVRTMYQVRRSKGLYCKGKCVIRFKRGETYELSTVW